MESRFKIRKKDGNVSYIQLVTNSEKKRVVLSTGLTIETRHWYKGSPLKTNVTKDIRSTLDAIKRKADRFIEEVIHQEKRQPNRFEWEGFLDDLKGKSKPSIQVSDLGSQFLSQRKSMVTESTYMSLSIHIRHFSSYLGHRSLSDLSKSLFLDYKTRLLASDLEISTINGYLKNLKVFLKWLYDNDHTENNFSKYVKKEKQVQKPIIAILESELVILEKAKLTNGRLDKVRDLFLFACYTGLRFSDVRNFSREKVTGNIMTVRQQKTGNTVTIPIIAQTRSILNKYDYQLPVISEQKQNAYLKELFRLLKIDREVVKTSQTANRGVKDTYMKLSDAITFHIARKSFISIALSKGINQSMVMTISGHRKYSEFQKYIAFANEDLSEEMLKFSER